MKNHRNQNNNVQNRKAGFTTQSKQNKKLADTGITIPLHPSDIMPPRIVRKLNYIDSIYQRNNAGNNYLVYAFRINDLWDPDPLLLTGSISGFKEIMQFYTTYRVMNFKIHLKISNNEAFPLLYGYVFSQTSLVGVIPTRDQAIDALENDFSTRARMISAKGGIDTEEIQSLISPAEVLGDRRQYTAELGYSGQGLATPAIPLYVNLIVASPSGAAIANGVTTALTLEFVSEFFGRTNLRA
jgi:hypothetical protein